MPTKPQCHSESTHVVILSSNTGGGHQACAEALKAHFYQRTDHQIEVSIVDLWSDNTPFPLHLLPRTYPFLVQHVSWFWGFLWRLTKISLFSNTFFALIAKWIGRDILTTLNNLDPDVIICVHPIVQRAVLPLYTCPEKFRTASPEADTSTLPSTRMGQNFSGEPDLSSKVPWFTMVTDLCASHPFWFDPRATRCFVAGSLSAAHAQENGLCPQQIRTTGLPIHPSFIKLKDETGLSARTLLLRKLGMDPTLPAALVMSGGDGIGNVARIADEVARHLSAVGGLAVEDVCGQLVVICGRNRSLFKALQAREWPIPVRLCGFVDNMAEWMAACDCVITKAGPSTIIEAVTLGKPLVLTGYIPGQESINVDFVVQNGAGLYCTDPAEIARTVRLWLVDEPESRAAFAAAARSLSKPHASCQIVDEVMGEIIDEVVSSGDKKVPQSQ